MLNKIIKTVLLTLALFFGMVLQPATSKDLDSRNKVLHLSDVLESSTRSTPEILIEIAEQKAAAGYAQAADGAFDVNITAQGFSRVTGFWSGTVVETGASQNIGAWGGKVYGKYRVSDGRFPIYEDSNFTNTLGEFKIGALFSLLRDRDIDKNRFNVRDTALVQQQAEVDVLFQKIVIQKQASQAYWDWVVAGHQHRVYLQLLTIANERQKALEKQAKEGAIADIFMLENRQNITRREKLVTEAAQKVQASAIKLSYFLRDTKGVPLIPEIDALPQANILDINSVGPNRFTIEPNELLRNRPEVEQLNLAIERLNQKVALSKNDLAPRLDLSLELSRDFGAIAEGGTSRNSTDTIVGLQFSLPLGQNTARGKLAATKAKRKALRHRARMLQEKIMIELQRVSLDMETAGRMLNLTKQEVTQTRLLADAEKVRFQNGASDFFLLNIREERAANAKIEEFKAHLAQRTAQANLYAASMNLKELGLN